MGDASDDETEDDSDDPLLAAVARIPVRTRAPEWTPPSELDEYQLIEPVGKGGMGSVWLARDRLLDRLVAVKFIAHAEPDKPTRERFAIEARAAARLQHPNVVSIYRFGEIAARPYLVTEYIRGESLDKLAVPIAWERALELGIALARGLAAAHRHGIVHRDIKPANAIITPDGDAKLVDFGLARLDHHVEMPAATNGSSRDPTLTAPGAIAGTPRYLSPEVRRGEPAGRRSDVYGIGCVLFELVIGRAPSLEPFDVAGRLGAAGGKLAAVIDRCLRADPSERYASGDELREALEQVQSPTGDAAAALPAGNPYRGLVAYDAEHRALFFGRSADIRAVVERLRSDPFALITGDSGAGKSSLCRAGVLPAIEDGRLDGRAWRTVQLVPHHRPLTTLATLLAPHVKLDEAATLELLRAEPYRLARELRRAHPDAGLVIFVDQLEELCTLSDHDEVTGFAAVLAECAAGHPNLRLLATVRSDFLTRVAELPLLDQAIARSIYLLRPLTDHDAREAIVGPARAKGARFESDELVDTLVAAVSGGNRIELPLLAFTLAQLWDVRDPDTQTISAKSLDAIGGVRGALARHADAVLERLLPEQRATARKLLLRLVTADKTRARRTADELAVFASLGSAEARSFAEGRSGVSIDSAVLDALVRGRLVVVRGDDPPTFEIAHERLIDGWPTLAAWVSDTAEAIAARGRLALAVVEWERMDRARDGLWGARQLVDLDLLETEDLTDLEASFAAASRRTVWRRRWLRRGIAIAIPLVALGVYVGARVVARRDLDRHINGYVAEAETALATARTERDATNKLRADAFALFDKPDVAHAEPLFEQAQRRSADARTAYAQASKELEAAFLLDTSRHAIREMLGDIVLERADLADHEYRTAERDDLLGRLALYDPDGEIAARRAAIAHVTNALTTEILLRRADRDDAGMRVASGASVDVAPGSYLATSVPGGVTQSFVVAAGEPARIDFALPARVPEGYIYVPPGTLLYGSREEEYLRRYYEAQPMHSRTIGAFLIGRTEVTYAQWIAFLDALPAGERDQRRPHTNATSEIPGGELELRAVDGTWELRLAPAHILYTARLGTPIAYRDRTRRQQQDWRKFPVANVSSEDGVAYAAWLDRTGALPHARLCSEIEWERAARGADGRSYPRGEKLAPDDANIDVTYDRKDGGMGPDEVGSHPASDSVFGVADMSGNVWDIVRGVDGTFVQRGGAYFITAKAAHLANRNLVPPGFRHPHMGLRICADP